MSRNYDGNTGKTGTPFAPLNRENGPHVRPKHEDYTIPGNVRIGEVLYSETDDGITVTVDAPTDFDTDDFNQLVEAVYGEEPKDGQQEYQIGPDTAGFAVAFEDYGAETAVHLQFDDPVTDDVEQWAMDEAEHVNRYLNGDSDAYLA